MQNPYSNHIGISKSQMYLVMLINFILIYLIYIRGDKPKEICEYYEDIPWANTKSARVLGWTYIFVSIISPFALVIARNAMIGKHLF